MTRTAAEQLVDRVLARQGRSQEGRRGRDDRRRRREDSRSRTPDRRRRRQRKASETSSDDEAGFREARGSHGNRARKVAQRAPGRLLESCLARMQEYLGQRLGSRELGEVSAIFTPYLSSVLMPTLGSDSNLRNTNELQNLAKALDYLMQGDVAKACDVLAQRFKAVEMATQDGSWNVARHVQLAGDDRVSTLSQAEREAATLQERHEARFKAASGLRH